MERLLVITLDVQDCAAELRLNGMPVARVDDARPRAVVPVHEYTMAGVNRLEMTVWPRPATTPEQAPLPPEARVSDGLRSAHARVLLPRIGSPADEASARTLAQLDWAPPEGQAYEAPVGLTQDVTLPVSFPRWRWMDAPVLDAITPEVHATALAFVQAVMQDLAAGETDRVVAATRLRSEELAVAYQRQPAEEIERWRRHLHKLHAAGSLKFKALSPEGLVLRRLAGGRLLDCLGADGLSVLSTEPDAQQVGHSLPLRITVLEGKVYVLR